MANQDLIKKYSNEYLARQFYKSDYKISTKEFSSKDSLLQVLYEIYSDESCLTRKGLEFLGEYYGLEKVAEMIMEEKSDGIDYHFKNKEEVIEWLKGNVNEYS